MSLPLFILVLLLNLLIGGCSPPPNPNKLIEYTLHGGKNLYIVSLPATYEYEGTRHFVTESGDGLWIYAIYPTMQPPLDQTTVYPGQVSMLVGTGPYDMDHAADFLKKNSTHSPYYNLVEKRGIYAVYHKKPGLPGIPDWEYLIFTAKDGELVLVEVPSAPLLPAVYRNIGKDISIKYHINKLTNNDYLEIDETVTNFIKAHLKSKPVSTQSSHPKK